MPCSLRHTPTAQVLMGRHANRLGEQMAQVVGGVVTVLCPEGEGEGRTQMPLHLEAEGMDLRNGRGIHGKTSFLKTILRLREKDFYLNLAVCAGDALCCGVCRSNGSKEVRLH